MTNQIVTVNVSQTVAPSPDTLQKTGALLSQGATTTSPGTSTLLTDLADLTAILVPAKTITSLVWAGSVVTVTTAAPHGFTNPSSLEVTIAGATPAAYNGTFLATVTGASTFTYPLVSNPGAETVPGTYIPESKTELLAMATTFFAQGSQQSVYVLELGPGSPADGVTYLGTWIGNNPGQVYAFLVPRFWASEASYLTFLAGFEATTSKTYFFTTMTAGNYTSFTAAMKCVVGLVEAPTIPATEFSLAAAFWVALHYAPSSTNKVTPFAFSFLFGVTAYPSRGNGALLALLKAAGVNVVGTGAEGGITNTILFWGTTLDGKDFTYWYSVDWVQLTEEADLANAVINGSNLPANPLYYNQDGINRLQAVGAGVLSSGVTFGLVLGTVKMTQLSASEFTQAFDNGDFDGQAVINAVPFVRYSADNPGDYAIGKYAGLAIVYVPARGFTQIIVNLNVSNFVAQ